MQTEFTIEQASVPLLSMEQRPNPMLRIEAPMSHQHSEFTIKQAAFGSISQENTETVGTRQANHMQQSDHYRIDHKLLGK